MKADSPAGQWMARVKEAGAADFPALMAEMEAFLKNSREYFAWEAARGWLLGRWIEKDAAGAADFVARKIKESPDDESLGSQLGLLLGEMDPAKAVEILAGPHKGQLGKYFEKAVMRAMASAWPAQFLALGTATGGDTWKNNQSRALSALAAADPQAAVADWTAAGGKSISGLAVITAAWAERNPAETRAWVESLETPEARHAGLNSWLGVLAKSDPRTALRELSKLEQQQKQSATDASTGSPPVPALRFDYARREVLAALARQSLGPALEAWKAMETPGQPQNGNAEGGKEENPDKDISQALAAAAKSQFPDEAGALLKALAALTPADADSRGRDRAALLAKELLRAKADAWPTAVRLEAAQLILADASAGTYRDIVNGWLTRTLHSDPDRLGPFVAALPENLRSGMAAQLLTNPDRQQTDFVRKVTASVPPEDWQPVFGTRLAMRPAENADFVAALPITPKTSLARSQFAGEWGREDPAAAAQWVAALPPDAGSIQAARGLADAWGRYDETAASAWASTLPPGPQRDGAALGLAASVSVSEPESAWQWAASIGDPPLRADAMFNVASAWGNQAPPEFRAAFTEALDQGGYTGATKARFLQALEQAPTSPAVAPAGSSSTTPVQ